MIINGFEQYDELLSRTNRERFVLTPILRDLYYHPRENSILCVGITFEDMSHYTLSISHDDAPQFALPNLNNAHSPNAKLFDCKTIDIASLAYTNGKLLKDIGEHYPLYVHDTHTMFGKLTDVNRMVPLTIWNDILLEYNRYLWDIVQQSNSPTPYMQELLKVLHDIEEEGLKVNIELLKNNCDSRTIRSFRGDMVYTEYNPFTITGRPSNRFGGINFSALNKSDGTRDMFISRYPNGELVQIDFEAYHLRLIAKELGIILPTDKSIHTEMAHLYFPNTEITDELYAESKRRTFELMYGMRDETYGIELFDKIKELRQSYENRDTLTLPSGIGVTVEQASANKLFNYYVQSLEMVRTLPKLQTILERLRGTTAHLILYTYDSILLDVEQFDTDLMTEIVTILEENKTFPVRIYRGKTYGSIEEIKL